jgi:phage baseplate assembly protein W
MNRDMVIVTTLIAMPKTRACELTVEAAVAKALEDWPPTIISRTVSTEYGAVHIARK